MLSSSGYALLSIFATSGLGFDSGFAFGFASGFFMDFVVVIRDYHGEAGQPHVRHAVQTIAGSCMQAGQESFVQRHRAAGVPGMDILVRQRAWLAVMRHAEGGNPLPDFPGAKTGGIDPLIGQCQNFWNRVLVE